ncbi:MAG: alcohol dehydrogenase catalytic domain-containing protein [Elusimicrobia bacterium]|nr:alcohol dehydrogenase catalytic domain-containing protein [Elusimicrobiota bacterium]
MNSTYRAVVIEGPNRARLLERSTPKLEPGEILVRPAWQGVCATDLEVFDGRLGYFKDGTAKYPIVPGHELSGRVAAAGEGVCGLKPGDPVVVECIQGCGECALCSEDNAIACPKRREMGVMNLDGGYAELVLAPARVVHRVPPAIPLRAASLCEPLAVVCKGLRRLGGAWGAERRPRGAAVIGAGAVGMLAALVLKSRGHHPAVIERDPGRRALAQKAGLEARAGLSGLAGFDCIVEATGNPEALHAAVAGSRPGASMLLLGLPYDQRPFPFESIVAYDRALIGSVGSGARDFKEALEILPRLDLSLFFGPEFPLEDYEKAWAAARAKTSLKVALRVDFAA